jgi:hypothetical protein
MKDQRQNSDKEYKGEGRIKNSNKRTRIRKEGSQKRREKSRKRRERPKEIRRQE